MSMALGAHGIKVDEDTVNEVMGASPLRGASWEDALACAQYFGCRGTLVSPCTLKQVKEWTDAKIPVLIAWNPEGRPWSHASLIFDVDSDTVYVADSNIPNPDETVRETPIEEFYKKWFENRGDYLVRRPAMAIEREITADGKPTMSSKTAALKNAAMAKIGDIVQLSTREYSQTLAQPLRTRRDYGAQESNMHSFPFSLLSPAAYKSALETTSSEDSDKEGKFEKGKSVPVEKLPEELQENVKNPPPEVKDLKEEMKEKAAGISEALGSNPPVLLTASDYEEELKIGKFEKGKSMTIDEVAAVVGPEFKEMNVNPPDSVVKVREDMQKSASLSEETDKDSKFEEGKPADPTKNMSAGDAKEWERQNEKHKDEFKTSTDKEAASGLYGATKDTEKCCQGGVKKLKTAAFKLAKEIYGKDEETPQFLTEHGKRTGSKTAKMLTAAMKEIGPSAALSKTAAGRAGLYGFKERTAKIDLDAC